MPTIDPSTDIGKIRLRIGDWQDITFLPDNVITSAITDCGGNVPRAAQLCAQYILAILSSKVHRRMTSSLEVWGAEWFDNYSKFLQQTILNPTMMDITILPYGGAESEDNPLIAFVNNWNDSYNNKPGSLYNTTDTY